MSEQSIKEALQRISAVDYQGPLLSPLGLKASRIASVFLAGEPGDVVLDEQWPAELRGVSPRGKAYSALEAARRYALAKGIVWRRVAKERRLKCLLPDERGRYAGEDVRRVRRRARHGLKVAEATDRGALSRDEAALLNATVMVLAITEKASAQATVKAIVARPEPSPSFLAEHVLGLKD